MAKKIYKKEKHTWMRAAYMPHLPDVETTGYKVGVFGLYKLGKDDWRVTHLPTGSGVHVLDRSTLAAAVKAAQSAMLLPVNWSLSDKDGMTKELRKVVGAIDKMRGF